MKFLEYTGVLAAVIGASLLASNTGASGYGYISFLISSLLLAWHAIYLKCWGLFSMQALFSIINYVGILRWL